MENRRRRPLDYQYARAELERSKREHLRYADPDCQCPWHVGREGMEKRLADKIKAARAGQAPPPF